MAKVSVIFAKKVFNEYHEKGSKQDAKYYQDNLAVKQTFSPNFPASSAQIVIVKDTSISGNYLYIACICEAATSLPPLLNYIHKRNLWTKSTMDLPISHAFNLLSNITLLTTKIL